VSVTHLQLLLLLLLGCAKVDWLTLCLLDIWYCCVHPDDETTAATSMLRMF